MSNPNLDIKSAYLRKGAKIYKPERNGTRDMERDCGSITSAKRFSRELMKQGHTIVTK